MKLNIFGRNKERQEIEEEEDKTPNVGYFFKLLWRRFTKLLSINLVAVLQFIPLVAAYLVYFWADTTTSVALDNLSFPLMQGVSILDPSAGNMVLLTLCSGQTNLPIITLWMTILRVALILLFVATFGWFNVGHTYLMREMINGRPVFIFSDIKHAIKKTAKQGFFLGLVDVAVIFILYTNLSTLAGGAMQGFLGDVSYVANLAIAIIYMFMRFYLYLMAITFDMKMIKIIKNALIFVMLGIKRNLMAVLWIAIMVGINVLVFLLYTPLGLILPFFYILSFPAFTAAYAAYPIIQKYMIDPSPYANADVDE